MGTKGKEPYGDAKPVRKESKEAEIAELELDEE